MTEESIMGQERQTWLRGECVGIIGHSMELHDDISTIRDLIFRGDFYKAKQFSGILRVDANMAKKAGDISEDEESSLPIKIDSVIDDFRRASELKDAVKMQLLADEINDLANDRIVMMAERIVECQCGERGKTDLWDAPHTYTIKLKKLVKRHKDLGQYPYGANTGQTVSLEEARKERDELAAKLLEMNFHFYDYELRAIGE
ncbi:MAG: hypothetical protein KKB38_20885 [Gammaproteobacteria bacterium]|nr:hypothetical protein [Gammaproteobacteria bacterium]